MKLISSKIAIETLEEEKATLVKQRATHEGRRVKIATELSKLSKFTRMRGSKKRVEENLV